MRLYFFGWPGYLGGAATKLAHLLQLLHDEFEITVVADTRSNLEDSHWKRRLERWAIPCCLFEELPLQLDGWGVALCNYHFLRSGIIWEARKRGLKFAWSNEMTRTFAEEAGLIILGLIDVILYVSAVQRAHLEPHYSSALSGTSFSGLGTETTPSLEGWIHGGDTQRRLRWVNTGNYIDSKDFPFKSRDLDQAPDKPLTVGRLSRADLTKFPENFPHFYEQLGLKSARFRVMGWDQKLADNWKHHRFDQRWELLPELSEVPMLFLQSLDLFIYSVGTRCNESWGRAVVEAMLTGAIPLVPADPRHHLHNLVEHHRSGFHCHSDAEYGHYARLLETHTALRYQMSVATREHALREHCDSRKHIEIWKRVFYGAPGS